MNTALQSGPTPSKAARIWRRTRVGALLAAVLVAVLWLTSLPQSSAAVWGVGALLALVLAFEVARMGALEPMRLRPALLSAAALACAFSWVRPLESGPLDLLAATGAAGLLAFAIARFTGSPARAAAGLAIWLAAPLPAMGILRAEHGHGALVALLILSKIGDIAGYYGGSALGRHHPFPRLSPGKTTEGCLASAAAGVLAGALLGLSGVLGGEPWQGALLGLCLNLAAQGGDLAESALKRRAGVKDSGVWFGPSGGLFDLVDSLLFTVPAAVLLWPLIFP